MTKDNTAMASDTTTVATPNPGATALTGAAGLAAIFGWGATALATRLHVPVEVIGAALTGIATVATSLWHRLFGPGVRVNKADAQK